MVLLLLNFIFHSHAQDSSAKYKPRIFRAYVYGNDSIYSRDFIAYAKDSSIAISKLPLPFNKAPAQDANVSLIPYSSIDYIKIQRKGSVGRGIVTGVLSGFFAGILIGLAEGGDDPDSWFAYSAGEKAIMYGATAGIAGGIIGAIIGGVARKKFIINKTPSKLQEMNRRLLEKVYY